MHAGPPRPQGPPPRPPGPPPSGAMPPPPQQAIPAPSVLMPPPPVPPHVYQSQQQHAAPPSGYEASALAAPQPPSHAQPSASPGPSSSAAAAAAGEGAAAKDLPPALRARLMARGLLKPGDAGAAPAPPASQQQQQRPVQEPGAAVNGSAAHAAPEPVLPGWCEAVDPRYSRTYYYNPMSRERLWLRPVRSLPRGWATAADPTSGVTYYYNPATGAPASASAGPEPHACCRLHLPAHDASRPHP
jgi:hypothetical protein